MYSLNAESYGLVLLSTLMEGSFNNYFIKDNSVFHRNKLTNTDDIVGIFDFIAPHFFSSYDFFYDYYIRPIMLSYRSKQRNVLITGILFSILLNY